MKKHNSYTTVLFNFGETPILRGCLHEASPNSLKVGCSVFTFDRFHESIAHLTELKNFHLFHSPVVTSCKATDANLEVTAKPSLYSFKADLM